MSGEGESVTCLGDVNCDGVVNILDIARLDRCLLGLDSDCYCNWTNADANQDGKISSADITAIEQIILGLPPCSDCPPEADEGVTLTVNSPGSVVPNSPFIATVKTTAVIDLYSLQIEVQFDPAVLSIPEPFSLNILKGSFVSDAPNITVIADNSAGWARAIIRYDACFPGKSGVGELLEVNFNVLEGNWCETSNITLSSSFTDLSNTSVQRIPVEAINPATYTVANNALTADFSASPTTGPAPLTVNFSDSSSGDVLSWLWDFGDGNTSSLQNPSHIYTGSGAYTVSLSVSDTCGSATETKIGYITVNPCMAELILTKTSEPWGDTDCTQIVHKGDTIYYILQYDNSSGDTEAVNTILTDYLDPGLTVIDNGGATYDSPTHTLTWDLGTLAAYPLQI